MESENLKDGLSYFIMTVMGDIEALELIALEAGEKDVDEAYKTGRVQVPATVSHGRPVKTHASIQPRCTIPLAMLCFSVIDVVGKLVKYSTIKNRGPLSESSSDTKSKNDFALHAKIFFKELGRNDDLNNDQSSSMLQNAYRHSLAHSFLPLNTFKVGYLISYSTILDGYSLFFRDEDYVVLNVKYLTQVVKRGLSELEKRLATDEINLYLDSYEYILNENEAKLKY